MKRVFFYILIALILVPSFSSAQYKLLEPLPCIDGTDNICENGAVRNINLNTYIGYVFKFSIALAAFLAIIQIIVGGLQIMTSESPFKIGNGKERIQNAIIGLVMVLASYLILATIDPRLVEINTTIPDVNVDIKDVQSFQTKLTQDLAALNAENQLKFQQMNNELKDVDQRIKNLEAKVATGEITRAKFEIEMAKEKANKSKLEVGKSSLIAENNGAREFKTALEIIHDPTKQGSIDLDQYTAAPLSRDENFVNGKYRTDTKNKIEQNYNIEINQLLSITPRTPEIIEAIPKLTKQRDYYIAQAREEAEVFKKANGHNKLHVSGQQGQVTTTREDNSKYLNEKLNAYKASLDNPVEAEAAGISVDQYKTMLNARIQAINTALETK